MQSIIRAIYPSHCVACDAATAEDHGLCGPCWIDTAFITGTTCDLCGTPLMGDGDSEGLKCDDCITIARPWSKGRAVFGYSGVGRRLVLGLKHGDRTDLVPAAATWMVHAGKGLLDDATLILPVPVHWTRLIKRRYNQAAMLARQISKISGVQDMPDGLVRIKRTNMLDRRDRVARFSELDGAIIAKPNRVPVIRNQNVLIVDDVMTSGATLAACAAAALDAGAAQVCILTLARVVKDA